MTAFKAKVMAVYPDAFCSVVAGDWWVYTRNQGLGVGKTAFSAWVDAWRGIEKERGGK